MASAIRSLGGKNVSSSKTPSRRIGGSWICIRSEERSRSMPCPQACSTRFASRMCSRLVTGSASMPASTRRPDTRPSISSRRVSWSCAAPAFGAERSPRTFRGIPAVEPGVKIRTSAPSANARTSAGPSPEAARPFVHRSAVRAASSAVPTPSRAASAGSTHGSKSRGARSGKRRARFPMSPFGSRMSAGIPASRTSSRSTTPSPVLPDPVMPTITPCVVR